MTYIKPLSISTLLTLCTLASISTLAHADGQVSCQSIDYQYNNCSFNAGSNNVYLDTQTSNTECIQGKNWGYNSSSVWVDKGCSGVFKTRTNNNSNIINITDTNTNANINQTSAFQQVTCKSSNYNYKRCSANVGNNYVSIGNKISKSSCQRGTSWDYDNNGIWVDKGCAATFIISNQPRGNTADIFAVAPGSSRSSNTISCKSKNYSYQYCNANVGSSSVRLSRQTSNTTCNQGQNWGYDAGGIWVDKGCSGQFSIGS